LTPLASKSILSPSMSSPTRLVSPLPGLSPIERAKRAARRTLARLSVSRLRHTVIASIILVAIAFAAFVWPTPFRYEKLQRGNSTVLVRMNRFTGVAEYLTTTGWSRTVVWK